MSKMNNKITEIKVLYDLAMKQIQEDKQYRAERGEIDERFWGKWDDELFTTEVAGVVSSLVNYGEHGRWGIEPEETIKFLERLAPFENDSFRNWVVKYGQQFAHFLNQIYLYEGMRLLCMEYAREVLRQRENPNES